MRNKKREIISGVNPIYEALKAGKRKIEKIWIAHKDTSGLSGEILSLASQKKVQVIKTSREEIFNLSRIEKHQGIIAEIEQFEYSSVESILNIGKDDPSGHFIVVLDNILDPQNLGSIIRTAHLCGVHGVIIPERNSASIGPASTRASAGAVEYIPIARVTNIAKTLKELKNDGIWVSGAEGGGKSLYSHEFSGSCAIVIGSEGQGMRRLVRENCDFLLEIPMNPVNPGVGSYNASVAAAMFMGEASRQRLNRA